MVGRKAHAVHQQLPFIKWAEISWRRIAKTKNAEQLVLYRIDN